MIKILGIMDKLRGKEIETKTVKHVEARRTYNVKKFMACEEQNVMEGMRRQRSWQRMELKWMEEQWPLPKL